MQTDFTDSNQNIRYLTKHRKKLTAGIALACGLAAVALFPLSDEGWEQAVVWMECRTTYAFAGAEGDTLFCSSLSIPLFDIEHARRPDRAGRSRMHTAIFVSGDGCLIAPAPADTLPSADSLNRLLTHERERLARLHKVMDGQLDELDYYARTHSTVDDGYTDVMSYRTALQLKRDRLDSLRYILDHVSVLPTIRHEHHVYPDDDSLPATEAPAMECAQLTQATDGLALFGIRTHRLPSGRQRAGLPLWAPAPEGLCRLWAFCHYCAPNRSTLPRRARPIRMAMKERRPDYRLPHSADGTPVVRQGRWAGVYLQGTCVDLSTIRHIIREHRPWWKETAVDIQYLWERLTAGLRKEDKA
ncbi:MAG: hypothetical protein NC388_06300 [Clostridium sp.]|nr:hypothetical protein [Clostridium sp.]